VRICRESPERRTGNELRSADGKTNKAAGAAPPQAAPAPNSRSGAPGNLQSISDALDRLISCEVGWREQIQRGTLKLNASATPNSTPVVSSIRSVRIRRGRADRWMMEESETSTKVTLDALDFELDSKCSLCLVHPRGDPRNYGSGSTGPAPVSAP
jgi:hypothetical protein